jgi:hypothetical protein
MILLYTILLFVLSVAGYLVKRRATGLEKKYVRLAAQADQVLRQPVLNRGNRNEPDPYVWAKRQYQLGCLVQKRDRTEARYTAWQGLAEKFAKWTAGLRTWKGKRLPYTCGVVDVTALLAGLDYLGAAHYVNLHNLYQLAVRLFHG